VTNVTGTRLPAEKPFLRGRSKVNRKEVGVLGTRTGSLWLPFTQMDAFDRASRTFVRGDGNYLIDARGQRVFDAVSSIWTTVHGHCHPAIVDAVARQSATLDHATLLGASNPVAEELAERLCRLAKLEYAFFASDGASAVEAALKMALQYWQNRAQPQRTRFLRLVDSYHGDTAAAMSVSDIGVFKARFAAITFETHSYDVDFSLIEADDVAAVIVEPLVQAAAGIRIVPPEHYAALNEIAPLLIVDEIATGFGRTGTMFAHEQLELAPDIVCVGKGITGGTLALSGTLVAERIYDAFRGEYADYKHFFHGHSYAGNPIACAAANASLDVFERERTLEHVQMVAEEIKPALRDLASLELVREVRGAGLMIGIELASERMERADAITPAWRVANALYERGYFTRPIGDVVQLVPPLSSAVHELHGFIDAIDELLTAS
jgi:adenosylmethionine-8-amino-7-oxononanoate aminotransferase